MSWKKKEAQNYHAQHWLAAKWAEEAPLATKLKAGDTEERVHCSFTSMWSIRAERDRQPVTTGLSVSSLKSIVAKQRYGGSADTSQVRLAKMAGNLTVQDKIRGSGPHLCVRKSIWQTAGVTQCLP